MYGQSPHADVREYAERMKKAAPETVAANIRNFEALKGGPTWNALSEEMRAKLTAKAQELYSLKQGDGMYGVDGVQDGPAE